MAPVRLSHNLPNGARVITSERWALLKHQYVQRSEMTRARRLTRAEHI